MEAAKKTIDKATTIDEIKLLANNDISLSGTEVAKIQNLVEEYKKASAANVEKNVKDAKAKAKGLIDGIDDSQVDGHDDASFNKIQPAKVAAKSAIDAAATIDEIKLLVNNDSSLSGTEFAKVQKLIEEYKNKSKEIVDAKAKVINYAKHKAKILIDIIHVNRVYGHDKDLFNKIYSAKKAAKMAIDSATTKDQIKSLANDVGILSGDEISKILKLVEEYKKKSKENADAESKFIKESKKKARLIIDGIKISKEDGHDEDSFSKIEDVKKSSKYKIDDATTIDEIKLLANDDGSLSGTEVAKVQKLIEEYKNKSNENAKALIDAKEKAKKILDRYNLVKKAGQDQTLYDRAMLVKINAKMAIDAASSINEVYSLANENKGVLGGSEFHKYRAIWGQYNS